VDIAQYTVEQHVFLRESYMKFGYKVRLHDIKVGVWCTMDAKQIIGPILYAEIILTGMRD
jgi:hypothetical protein